MGYKVHVVEARNRIGGRVHSMECRATLSSPSGSETGPEVAKPEASPATTANANVTVELGAAVLMGDVRGGNPLARLCSKYGVAMHKLDQHCPLHDAAEGGELLPEDADKQAEKLFNDLLDAAHEERIADGATRPVGVHESAAVVGTPLEVLWGDKWYAGRVVGVQHERTPAAEVLFHYDRWNRRFDEWLPVHSPRVRHVAIQHQALEQVLQRQLSRSALPLDKASQRALHWHLANLEFACAAPLTTVSAKDWDQDDENEYDGDHFILPRGGYGGLLSKIAEGLEIRLRCTVKGIHYDSDGVALDTSGGVMRADAVIVTLPLGVLQLRPEDGGVNFSPPLPLAKQQAISRLGFGILNKVALFFEAPFWAHATNFFGRVVANPRHRGRFFLFFNLLPASGAPVLLALAAGAAAAELEGAEDEEVTESAVAALRTMFGPSVPSPTRTIVTRWGADKYARGSYSYVHVGASGSDYATLGEPVGDRLFLAGEHTIMEHPATVVGAYLSGLRAARDLHQRQSKKRKQSGQASSNETPSTEEHASKAAGSASAWPVSHAPSSSFSRPAPSSSFRSAPPPPREPARPPPRPPPRARYPASAAPAPKRVTPIAKKRAKPPSRSSGAPPPLRLSMSRDGVRRRSDSLSGRGARNATKRGEVVLGVLERAALVRAARDI